MEGGRESVRSAFTKASTRDGMLSITVHDTHSGLLEGGRKGKSGDGDKKGRAGREGERKVREGEG